MPHAVHSNQDLVKSSENLLYSYVTSCQFLEAVKKNPTIHDDKQRQVWN